ncbi:MAG: protein-L-isoaspartate(D-aspartate) O-methyltransferase [Rhodospirillales bacterium]|nr:protein-L-isoaspartate(D-aspartate) O-methyltransferase [Rhodospirillales bacterium]
MLRHLFGASATSETMLGAIARDAQETGALTGRPEFSDAVMDAMRTVPREAFVPKAEAAFAWENRPLPIGHGQTISQPYIVALMTELLGVEPGARILEIGTGCGYQTAILCAMGATVYSIEVVEPLARAAAARLTDLGYAQATVRAGDGGGGWPEHAPYDGIIVTAAAPSVPPALVDQLKPGACLLIPVGRAAMTQNLQRICKRADGSCETTAVLPVAFVPLTVGRS